MQVGAVCTGRSHQRHVRGSASRCDQQVTILSRVLCIQQQQLGQAHYQRDEVQAGSTGPLPAYFASAPACVQAPAFGLSTMLASPFRCLLSALAVVGLILATTRLVAAISGYFATKNSASRFIMGCTSNKEAR